MGKEGLKAMNETERQRLGNMIAAMGEEEQRVVAAAIKSTDVLWDELRKRETSERNFQKAMEDLMQCR